MAKKVVKKQVVEPAPRKMTAIELMLNNGEIIDVYRQPEHIKALVNDLYLASGEKFRPSRRMSALEQITSTQEEIDEQIADCSFLPVPEDDSFLGLPHQFLKRDSRVHKMLVKALNDYEKAEEDN